MKTVVISILGTALDRRGSKRNRWSKWRPTISMCQQEDLIIDRLELLIDARSQSLADIVTEDIQETSPETEVRQHIVDFTQPWDFESVYSTLLDFSRSYNFKPDRENYLIHITTGTHVAQICLYLLTETRHLPGKLIQTSPPSKDSNSTGEYQLIDLDLSKYDQIASRFKKEHEEGTTYLKGGINTLNATFNRMIEHLEQVSIRSEEPILLMGPTGAGKSQLAQRVYQLRKHRGKLMGELVTVNCATLRGESAMSALFGHKKGAFTGANHERPGLLSQANGGLLFLDEIGELGLDEQAMLLRAIEDKQFLPLGADKEVSSDFQLISGTNRDLLEAVNKGHFREDLLTRIDLWTYTLPSLRERIEDLAPNIDYEIEKYAKKTNSQISFNKTAREKYLSFGHSQQGIWSGNFRDLNASITRMATLTNGGRITSDIVDEEIVRLVNKWSQSIGKNSSPSLDITKYLNKNTIEQMDYYEQACFSVIIESCKKANSMAEAGRILFDKSRETKASNNDSHRVKQILTKYGISFAQIKNI
ncbi:MAG: transcriptional regulator [Alteromonadaceae bacterium]|nr:MAG: transcriptional regulator [Alteromonadaceae bacterium]